MPEAERSICGSLGGDGELSAGEMQVTGRRKPTDLTFGTTDDIDADFGEDVFDRKTFVGLKDTAGRSAFRVALRSRWIPVESVNSVRRAGK